MRVARSLILLVAVSAAGCATPPPEPAAVMHRLHALKSPSSMPPAARKLSKKAARKHAPPGRKFVPVHAPEPNPML